MKILVIPDIHLKTWIIRLATIIMRWLINENENLPEDERQEIGAVFIGDLADDFDREDDTASYAKVFDACIEFIITYPTTYFCIGNHCVAYSWRCENMSGYSGNPIVQDIVRAKIIELREIFGDTGRFGFIHHIDNVIFSHAGLSEDYYRKYVGASCDLDSFISWINSMDPLDYYNASKLWKDSSPIWARLQNTWCHNYDAHVGKEVQVVGHTPLERVLYEEENRLLSTDVFSTQPNGKPIGDLSEKQFVVIDTVTMEYELISIPENILKDLYEDGGHLIDDWLGKKNGETNQ